DRSNEIGDQQFAEQLKQISHQFFEKMNDDFNTPDAITAWFDLVSASNQYLQRDISSVIDLKQAISLFEQFDQILGLLEQDEELLDEQIEKLIMERTEARQQKNWARSDEIRDLLLS